MIAYLENHKVFPESYSAPAGWYKGDYTVQMEEQVPPIVQEHLRPYYTELLSGYPDVLTTQVVSKITGYGKTAINNWCNQGYIKAFPAGGKSVTCTQQTAKEVRSNEKKVFRKNKRFAEQHFSQLRLTKS